MTNKNLEQEKVKTDASNYINPGDDFEFTTKVSEELQATFENIIPESILPKIVKIISINQK